MKFLIRSMEDSETGANNYESLELRDFKSAAQAVIYVKNNYDEDHVELFEIHKIKINTKSRT